MDTLYRAVARMRDEAGEYTLVSQPTPWRDSAERARADYSPDAAETWIETATWQREYVPASSEKEQS